MRALDRPLFACSALTKPATVVAGTTCEGAGLASLRLVGEGSVRQCGGGHDSRRRCSVLCLLGLRGLRQPLRWKAPQLKALLRPLFILSAWAQSATVVSGTTVESAALDSVRLVVVGSASHCGGGHDR